MSAAIFFRAWETQATASLALPEIIRQSESYTALRGDDFRINRARGVCSAQPAAAKAGLVRLCAKTQEYLLRRRSSSRGVKNRLLSGADDCSLRRTSHPMLK